MFQVADWCSFHRVCWYARHCHFSPRSVDYWRTPRARSLGVYARPPEWDQSAVIRKLWILEARWTIGFGHGRWQYAEKLPAKTTPEEVEAVLERYRQSERQRVLRQKPVMQFEYRAVQKLIEVLKSRVA